MAATTAVTRATAALDVRARARSAIVILVAALSACTTHSFRFNQTLHFGERIDAGEVDADVLPEVSGLVASRKNPAVLWTHNDSGDSNRIYALDTKGRLLGIYYLAGCQARDWEDIAVGPGPMPGEAYLYVGNIGDNLGVLSAMTVCRVPEPVLTGLSAGGAQSASLQASVQKFRYPDGPRDAETLLVDPLGSDLFVISKEASEAGVYRATFTTHAAGVESLVRVATLPLSWAVAGDISADGQHIIVKTLFGLYHWDRDPGESIAQAFQRLPTRLPYVREPQGEAVAWDAAGLGYYTLSERVFPLMPHLYYYPPLNH